jgi:hypothetical protein
MDQVLVEYEDKIINTTRVAKIIMWISVASVIIWILIPIIFLLFLIYRFKLSYLKNNQSLQGIFDNLNGKTIKELKSIQNQGESIEQRVADLLIAHKSMVTMLIVIGTLIVICIGVIIVYHKLGLEMV